MRQPQKNLRVGVVGVGYLGKFHAEKYAAMNDVDLVGVVDVENVQAEEMARREGHYRDLTDLVTRIRPWRPSTFIVIQEGGHGRRKRQLEGGKAIGTAGGEMRVLARAPPQDGTVAYSETPYVETEPNCLDGSTLPTPFLPGIGYGRTGRKVHPAPTIRRGCPARPIAPALSPGCGRPTAPCSGGGR